MPRIPVRGRRVVGGTRIDHDHLGLECLIADCFECLPELGPSVLCGDYDAYGLRLEVGHAAERLYRTQRRRRSWLPGPLAGRRSRLLRAGTAALLLLKSLMS